MRDESIAFPIFNACVGSGVLAWHATRVIQGANENHLALNVAITLALIFFTVLAIRRALDRHRHAVLDIQYWKMLAEGRRIQVKSMIEEHGKRGQR